MATPGGTKLAQTIRQKLEEINGLCEGLNEATDCQAPAERWSPKEIISHLCGPEGSSYNLRKFLSTSPMTIIHLKRTKL